MASLICRVCPTARLFVLKLEQSATQSINAQRNGHDVEQLERAIISAHNAGILMFCAANDQGIASDRSYPGACAGTRNIFKIGAAEASGAAPKFLGDQVTVDFLFPGDRVMQRYEHGLITTGLH